MPRGMIDSPRWVQNEDGSYSRNLSVGDPSAVKATKGALEAAEEAGIDIRTIEGSGRGGQVTKADVEAASA